MEITWTVRRLNRRDLEQIVLETQRPKDLPRACQRRCTNHIRFRALLRHDSNRVGFELTREDCDPSSYFTKFGRSFVDVDLDVGILGQRHCAGQSTDPRTTVHVV